MFHFFSESMCHISLPFSRGHSLNTVLDLFCPQSTMKNKKIKKETKFRMLIPKKPFPITYVTLHVFEFCFSKGKVIEQQIMEITALENRFTSVLLSSCIQWSTGVLNSEFKYIVCKPEVSSFRRSSQALALSKLFKGFRKIRIVLKPIQNLHID